MPVLPDLDGTSQLTQANQIGKLFTPLADDVLVLRRFEGVEGISELFEYRIDAISEKQDIAFGPLLGQHFSLEFEQPGAGSASLMGQIVQAGTAIANRQVPDFGGAGGPKRYFDGILTEAQAVGQYRQYYAYRLVLRPQLWLLGRRADCRIFKEMTLPALIKKLASGIGLQVTERLSQNYSPFEYCVQYRETELAFLSRLMEEYGVYYYFEHNKGSHKLVIADATSAHVADRTLPFIPLEGQDRMAEEILYSWTGDTRLRTGKVSLADYDYLAPRRRQETTKGPPGTDRSVEAEHIFRDYPGRFNFDRDSDGTRGASGSMSPLLTQVRLDAEQTLGVRKYAAGNAVVLSPGGAFTLKDHPTDDRDYLVVRATHGYQAPDYRSGGDGDGTDHIPHGHYELQPSDVQFRAPPITPRPRIYGPQTAFVVDRSGRSQDANGKANSEEIDVDKQGRIWVQFHWSRHFHDDEFSLPVRVAQMWAGSGWGWQVIPRIGMEVVVNFLEGDPDQPLVTGAVYNDAYKYPYKLPDNKTISGVKTDSSKGHNGFNELYFDDKKGSEKIKIKAEKDRETIVQDTESREVWNWQMEDIGKNFKKERGTGAAPPEGISHGVLLLHGSESLEIQDGDLNQLINRHWSTAVDTGDVSLTVKKGDQLEEISQGNYQMNIKMGNSTTELGMGNVKETLKMGNYSLKCSLGTISMEAMQQIELKCGQSKITMTPMSIKIESLMVQVEGQAMTDIKGNGMLTLKGGITMIN